MSSTFDSYQKRRLRSSYFSVIISITLVLFLVGLLGLVLLKSNQIANHFKKEVVITLYLKNSVNKKQINSLQLAIDKEEYTNSSLFTSKEEAAKQFSADLGEDFVKYIGENPLKNNIDIYLNPDYVDPDKMETIANKYLKNSFVFEVSYNKSLVDFLTKNIKKMTFWLLIASGFLALISMLLINSSIRLSIYSKRFNIKTMQMVGATKRFIRKPFLFNSVKLGIVGAFLSLLALGSLIYYLNEKAPSLALLEDINSLLYLIGGVVFVAIVITWISSYFATQKFLNLNTDQLYD